MRVDREIVYARPAGFRPLALDLYVPDAPAALCVYLHGGGWRVGSRAQGPVLEPTFFAEVAARGLAVASVDYRLSGEATYPAQSEDVAAALDFLAQQRIADRTVAWGVSAGGHLAALSALAHGSAVAAAVCWYSPMDLDALAADVEDAGGTADRSVTSREGALIGAALDERPDLVAAASPVRHVRPGAPPFLLLHGDADRAVPHRQSERFAEALAAAGGKATVELVPGASHMFPELDDAAARAVLHRSVDFLLS